MSTDAADVMSLLPADRRFGEVRVVDVTTADAMDSQGDDAIRVVLTLALPSGETWEPPTSSRWSPR